MNVNPDFAFKSNQEKTALDYIHRATDNGDIYFVANRFSRKGINDFEFRYLTTLPDRYEHVTASFRVTGKIPQLWDPKTGEISEVLAYREENGRTLVPLNLEPDGSVFVVFNNSPAKKHIVAVQKDGKSYFPENQSYAIDLPYLDKFSNGTNKSFSVSVPGNYTLTWSDGKKQVIKAEQPMPITELSGKWDVRFDAKWGGPEHLVMNELKSWIKFEEPGIKYYSGTANYSKSFDLTKKELNNRQVILDLGNVHEMASVKINGQQQQVIWSSPFRFDITKLVQSGQNTLEVEVVNMWANRLIGDAGLPAEQRLTKTNINKFNGPDREKYLRESGLLGPVRLIFPAATGSRLPD